MEERNNPDVIDLRVVFRKIWQQKMLFAKVLPVVFILSCVYILSIPRTYSTDTKMAPEMEGSMGGGMLGSIASSFGFDINDMQTSDAITPLLYPDLMEDNGFVTELFKIKVKSQDGTINTDYFTYLKKHQKKAWWKGPINWVKSLFKSKTPQKNAGEFNPYTLSKDQDAVAEKVRNDIKLSINKKNGIITISTKAQDALICKTLADSVRERLQVFITDYRTNKARIDLDYYKKLTAEAKHEYEKARQRYGTYSDANTDVVLESYRAKQSDLENDMQLKYNTYSALSTQLQQAKAKVQERTPAFTTIKGAAVPVKPSGPKRMLFVLGMLFLAFIGTIFYITKNDILAPIMSQPK